MLVDKLQDVSSNMKLRISRKEEAEKRNNFARPPRRQPMKGIATLAIYKSRKWRRSILKSFRRHFLRFQIFPKIQGALEILVVAKIHLCLRVLIFQY